MIRVDAGTAALVAVRFDLYSHEGSYELVGEGMMQWAPDHQHVVAYWDYTVEND